MRSCGRQRNFPNGWIKLRLPDRTDLDLTDRLVPSRSPAVIRLTIDYVPRPTSRPLRAMNRTNPPPGPAPVAGCLGGRPAPAGRTGRFRRGDRPESSDVRVGGRRRRIHRRPLGRWHRLHGRTRDRGQRVRHSRDGWPRAGALARPPAAAQRGPPPSGRRHPRHRRGQRPPLVRCPRRRPDRAALLLRPEQRVGPRGDHRCPRRGDRAQPRRSARGSDRSVLRPRHLHRRNRPSDVSRRAPAVGQDHGQRRHRRGGRPDQRPRLPASAPGRGSKRTVPTRI